MKFFDWCVIRENDTDAVKQAICKGLETYKQITKPAPAKPASQKKEIISKVLAAETKEDLASAVRQMMDAGVSIVKKRTAAQDLRKWMLEHKREKAASVQTG